MPATVIAAPSPLEPPPAVAFFGPMLGCHDGWVTTQGEVVADLFRADGWPVKGSARAIDARVRAVHHLRDLLLWRRQLDMAVVSVFSGRGFGLADEVLSACRALGLPSVAWLHGGNLPDFGSLHPRWAGRVLKTADAVAAPTAYLARWAEATTGRSATVIPNVLDLRQYRYRRRHSLRPRLLWMRTFQELYDPRLAVHTLDRLRRAGVDAHLTMAGQDKGLQPDTQALVHHLGMEDAVSFAGFVSGHAKATLFDGHDIFLNTNLVDNAPVTVLEAAASGLAIVSTDVGGIPDLLVDGQSALLVPPRSAATMSMAVGRLLSEPDMAATISAGGAKVAETSAWPAVRSQWSELFKRLRD